MGVFCSCGISGKGLYERLGGKEIIGIIVRKSYLKIMADERISELFQNVDWNKLNEHQLCFLTVAFGGPKTYTGKSLREAHKEVNDGKFPDDIHFIAFVENVMVTLKELYIPESDINKIFDILLRFRVDVLGLDEDEEKELNKLVDSYSLGQFSNRESREKQSGSSAESLAVCPQSDNQKNGRRLSFVKSSGCVVESQFAALYCRQSKVTSVDNEQNGTLKAENRTISLKHIGDSSNSSSNRPSLVSRISLLSSSQRPSFLGGSWGSGSSKRPSFLGSGSWGSRKSSFISLSTGWLSSTTAKWLAKDVDVATMGHELEGLVDSSATSSSTVSESNHEETALRGNAWEEKADQEAIGSTQNSLNDTSQRNRTSFEGAVDGTLTFKVHICSPIGENC